MILSKENLPFIDASRCNKPLPETFTYPEKVLQFGTGVLLRGLPDYYIHQANQQGVFKGRVVVVKSTSGDASDFDTQDGLYTLCIRGVEAGDLISENLISSAISRVLKAQTDWNKILDVAISNDLEIIISNTTEIGITFQAESIKDVIPQSFPGKLLAVLFARYNAFLGDPQKGLVIVPTELIPDNASKLKTILLELARYNELPDKFIHWLNTSNSFCNTLVDRIVPGKPDDDMAQELARELGYRDALLAIAEPYSLWAIEGDESIAAKLSFAKVHSSIVINPDIEIYRELKVRLLNGTHTLASGMAVLAGILTVKAGMKYINFKRFIEKLMHEEISVSIPYEVSPKLAFDFALSVIDRFSNPFIEHLWQQISFQYSLKMKIRVLPLFLKYVNDTGKLPRLMSFGMAAFLRFMQFAEEKDGAVRGLFAGLSYPIKDDSYALFRKHSNLAFPADYIHQVLQEKDFWGTDLSQITGLEEQLVKDYLEIEKLGMPRAIQRIISN
ncbi:MAG: tagaturonate reductase [Pedobacter sp.]|nr:MAG: tagaturonate reductase [Pedobacter sp.]